MDIFPDETQTKERCKNCKYNKRINAQGNWWFNACYCKPYRGKRVTEIKDCPKENKIS